jgi:hypothetical protein
MPVGSRYVFSDPTLATFRRKIHFPEVTRRNEAKAPEKKDLTGDRRSRLEKPNLEVGIEVDLD